MKTRNRIKRYETRKKGRKQKGKKFKKREWKKKNENTEKKSVMLNQ